MSAFEAALGRLHRSFDEAGIPIRFCTPEDLILHKIISERPKDLEDIRGVLAAQRGKLDLLYLEPRIRELADLLGRPAILEEYLRHR